MVPPSAPGGPVGGREHRLDFRVVEVADDGLFPAFGRDGQDLGDEFGVLGVRSAAWENSEWIAARRALRVRVLFPRFRSSIVRNAPMSVASSSAMSMSLGRTPVCSCT